MRLISISEVNLEMVKHFFIVENKYGTYNLIPFQVLRCSNIAVVKVAEITELIHKALENDRTERYSMV